MTYFSNQYDLTYTLNNNYASVCCKPKYSRNSFSLLLVEILIFYQPHIKLVHYIMHVFLRVVKGGWDIKYRIVKKTISIEII